MNNLVHLSRNLAWFLTLLLVLPNLAAQAMPFPQGKLTGELWVTGNATINGKPAVSGATIVSGSRIETGATGLTSINLGKVGRVAVQPGSGLLLDFQENAINGELNTGSVIVNVPAGVVAKIKTPHKEVTVPVEQTPATVTVRVSDENTQGSIVCDYCDAKDVANAGATNQARRWAPLAGWVIPVLAMAAVGGGVGIAVALSDPPIEGVRSDVGLPRFVTPFIP